MQVQSPASLTAEETIVNTENVSIAMLLFYRWQAEKSDRAVGLPDGPFLALVVQSMNVGQVEQFVAHESAWLSANAERLSV